MTPQEQLWRAAKTGDKATLRALAFADVDFDARDDQDRTAFNIATQYGHSEAAQVILAARQVRAMQGMGLISPQYVAAQHNKDRRNTDHAA